MALGEYVSVSSQRDSERTLLAKERRELIEYPAEELKELAGLYMGKGLSAPTAQLVAEELTAKDAFAAHADIELGIDPDALTNPWHAGISSAIAFVLGALLPLLAIVIPPASARVPVTFVVVLLALAITGTVSAHWVAPAADAPPCGWSWVAPWRWPSPLPWGTSSARSCEGHTLPVDQPRRHAGLPRPPGGEES